MSRPFKYPFQINFPLQVTWKKWRKGKSWERRKFQLEKTRWEKKIWIGSSSKEINRSEKSLNLSFFPLLTPPFDHLRLNALAFHTQRRRQRNFFALMRSECVLAVINWEKFVKITFFPTFSKPDRCAVVCAMFDDDPILIWLFIDVQRKSSFKDLLLTRNWNIQVEQCCHLPSCPVFAFDLFFSFIF